MIPTDLLDKVIDKALLGDASAMPKFGTVPNERLTAKLALKVASRGMLSTLGGKLLLLGGGVLLTIGALYLIPESRVAPPPAVIAKPAAVLAPGQTVAAAPSSVAEAAPAARAIQKVKPAESKPAAQDEMKLNDRGDSTIPRVVDPYYHPPVTE